MDVVPAAVPAALSPEIYEELHALLGEGTAAHLRHLLDGRAVHLPGLLPGPQTITSDERSPRIRFLTGALHLGPAGRWLGPVLLEPAQWVATYVDPAHLAHPDCARCAPKWAAAAGYRTSFQIVDLDLNDDRHAQWATPPLHDATLRST